MAAVPVSSEVHAGVALGDQVDAQVGTLAEQVTNEVTGLVLAEYKYNSSKYK